MIQRRLNVHLGERSYAIHIGSGILGSLGSLCRRHHIPDDVAVLADTNSAGAGLDAALLSLKKSGFRVLPIVFPAGERQKSLERAEKIHSRLLRAGIPRRAGLVALGGGVVGDVGGFVASTYRRGITLVQCPTTLLSQVDSSVGGKNAVNHPKGKNVIGSYLQPRFVLSDTRLLRSLPRREIVSGLGEIVKYPFVGDPALLALIEKQLPRILRLEQRCILEVATRCLRIKTRFVSNDEREMKKGGRRLLNVGHTIAHPIETLSDFRLRHGEAVFLGMIVEGSIAVNRGWLDRKQIQRLIGIYHSLQCRFNIRSIPIPGVLRSVFSSPSPSFVLPRRFGTLSVVNDVTREEVRRALVELRRL